MTTTATCKETGRVVPVIDPRRCEAKSDCVQVCPTGVFEIRKLTADERGALGWFTRLKVAVHGNQQAFVVHPELCASCGLCVPACPERAIQLVPASGRGRS